MSMLVYLWIISYISIFISLFWILVVSFLKFDDRKKLDHFPKVTIGIPVWNEGETIIETLKSLDAMDYPKKQLEIIVIDDGSTDNTLKLAKNYAKGKKHIIVLKNQKNSGKSFTVNRIIEMATGEYFAVVDADSTVDHDYLKKSLTYFTNDNVAAVCSQIKVKDPKSLMEKIQRVEIMFGSYMRKAMLLIGTQHYTNGVMSIFKFDILKKVGGFNKKVLTEDLEIAIRLRSLGYDVRLCEDAYGYTKMPSTFKGVWMQRLRWYRGYIQTFKLHWKMIGNKNFGLLGLFQMPLGVLTQLMLLIFILIFLYQFFSSIHQIFLWLTAVEWALFSTWQIPTLSSYLSSININLLYPGLVILILGLYLYIKAHKHTGEKWKYTIPTLVYIFIYPLFLGFNFWHACLAEIFKTKERWR